MVGLGGTQAVAKRGRWRRLLQRQQNQNQATATTTVSQAWTQVLQQQLLRASNGLARSVVVVSVALYDAGTRADVVARFEVVGASNYSRFVVLVQTSFVDGPDSDSGYLGTFIGSALVNDVRVRVLIPPPELSVPGSGGMLVEVASLGVGVADATTTTPTPSSSPPPNTNTGSGNGWRGGGWGVAAALAAAAAASAAVMMTR